VAQDIHVLCVWALDGGYWLFACPCRFSSGKEPSVHIEYRYAPHNDVSVNEGPHIRLWSHKIIILHIIK
jgi:hypothetical protein